MSTHHRTPKCLQLLTLAMGLLVACSEDGSAQPDGDAGIDWPMVVDAPVSMDVAGEPDTGMDATSMQDGGPDATASHEDVAPTGDEGLHDVTADVRSDAGMLLEVPIDPMGVPAPGSECTGDAGVRPGDPAIAPPRPILPQSVSRVTSQRPSFRWALPEGTTGARVEVCADRCCTRVLQTLEAEGSTVRPVTALPPGVVYWRMFGRRSGVTGSRASYTWEFEVRRMDTPVDSSWGTIRDFTGDGHDDLLVLSGEYNPDRTRNFYVVEGGPGGPRAPRVYATVIQVPGAPAHVGDFNGDGLADLGYLGVGGASEFPDTTYAIESNPRGMPRVVRMSAFSTPGAEVDQEAVVDWNGDGYSDLVTTVVFYDADRRSVLASVLLVYHGSPTGLGDRPQQMIRLDSIFPRPWVEVVSGLGDADQDGYGDIVVVDRIFSRSGHGWTVLFGQPGGVVPRGRSFGGASSGIDPETWIMKIRPAGDLEGDGLGEVAFGLEGDSRLYLYRGASGLDGPPEVLSEPIDAGRSIDFGSGVNGADLNGDGFADLMVGAPFSFTETLETTGIPFNRGRLYVYFGSRTGRLTDPIWFGRVRPTVPGDNPAGFAETSLSPGDLNADGLDDAAMIDFSRHTCCYVYGTAELTGMLLGDCAPAPGIDIY